MYVCIFLYLRLRKRLKSQTCIFAVFSNEIQLTNYSFFVCVCRCDFTGACVCVGGGVKGHYVLGKKHGEPKMK